MQKKMFISFVFLVLTLNIGFSQGRLLFRAKDLQGKIKEIHSSKIKKPIVILFWATWCLPCKEELKQMKKVYQQFKDKIDFLAVSVDDPRTVSKVRSYVRSQKLPYEVLLDTDQQIIRKFGGNNPPFSLVININGDIIYSHTGYKKGDERNLIKVLKKLVN